MSNKQKLAIKKALTLPLKSLYLTLAVCWPSYSSSEGINPYFGSTGNAAADGALRWSMDSVLPTAPGLEIDNVIYSYRIRKETGELVTVHVYGERADGTGYVFRTQDDWKPGSLDGTEIYRVVPLDRLHRDIFGDGGIDVVGNGSVEDPSVIYSYRVDPCYDPQFDPSCPGYQVEIPDIYSEEYVYYDGSDMARRDSYDDSLYDEEEEESDEEREEREAEEERDRAERLEKALAAADSAALFAQGIAASAALDSLQLSINSYTDKNIAGGVYRETITLRDAKLPDSRSGLRNGLAQQLLHKKMVESQYR